VTTKSTALNKSGIIAIRADLQAALEGVARQHGLTLELAGITYNSAFLRTRLRMVAPSAVQSSAPGVSSVPATFVQDADRYGLLASDFGRTFRDSKGEAYRITGIVTKRHRYPISATRLSDGGGTKWSALSVLALLKASTK
jgi:hypothetical protein